MNLNDLRTHLQTQADHLGHSKDDPMPALRRRATTIRRRRVAAAAVTAAAAVACAVVLSGSLTPKQSGIGPVQHPTASATPIIGGDGLPSVTPAQHPQDVADGPYRFRYQVGGERLLAGRIGAPSQTQLEFTVQPVTGKQAIRYFCTAPFAPDSARRRFEVLVNGTVRAGGGACLTDEPAADDMLVGTIGIDKTLVGRPVNVALRITDLNDQPIPSIPDLRMGIGVYEPGAHRTIGGVDIPEVIEHQGVNYQLGMQGTALARDKASATMVLPANTAYLVVFGGSTGTSVDLVSTVPVLAARAGDNVLGPGRAMRAVPSQPKAGTARVEATVGSGDGVMFMAYYTPVK